MITIKKIQKPILYALLSTLTILLIPLIAMQLTNEVQWSAFDFLIASVMIFGFGCTLFYLISLSQNILYRLAIGLTLVSCFFMIWVNLAVGIIGSEQETINLSYFGLIFLTLLAAVKVKFESKWMCKILYSTALLQAAITAVILLFGYQHQTGITFTEIVMINFLFIGLWILAGELFRRSLAEVE